MGRPMPDGFPRQKGERPWVCRRDEEGCTRTKPCRACLGARSRRSGMRKQREARKALEVVSGAPAARFVGQLGNEESWTHLGVRVEAKSGKAADVVATKFTACEQQSKSNHAIGDARPFASVHMPTGWGSDGIFSCRLSELGRVVEALVNL